MSFSKDTYPEIYFSTIVEKALNAKPKLPNKPTEPQPPQKPINPGEYDSGGNGVISFIGIIISVIILFYVVSADEFYLEAFLCAIGLFLCTLFLFKTTSWDKDSHEEKKQAFNKASKDYPYLLEKYENDLIVYEEQKRIYEKKVSQLLSKNGLALYRAKKIDLILHNSNAIPTFLECNDNDSTKIGASENFFVEYLLNTDADCKIYTNMKVPVGNKFYYPDIICKIYGLYFDIEIDEPYAGNDGTPIHYLESIHEMFFESVDIERNEYMTEKGWNVIRFSEEQIFSHPDECVDIIFNIANSIIMGTDNITIPEHFVTKKWTKEQSHKMSYKRFRKTYVPIEYQTNIDKEDYRSYAEIKNEIFNSENET